MTAWTWATPRRRISATVPKLTSTVAGLLRVPTGIVRAAILSDDYIGTLAAQAELKNTT
jgi:hypothetical protein